MANSVGGINFGVGIDAGGISAELNAALAPALARVQAKLDRNPLKVPIKIDTTEAIKAAQLALKNADLKATAKVTLDLKITAAQRAALQEIRNLSDKSIRVDFNVNLTADQVKQIRDAASAIRRLESKSVRVDFAVNLTDDQVRRLRDAATAIRRLSDKRVNVQINLQVDEVQLRRVAEILRGLHNQSVNVRVNTNADTITGRVRSLNRELGYIPGAAAGIAGVAAALAGITGAAGAALGAVGGLAIGLLALGPALAAIGATAVVGFEGVGDAFKALGEISSNAAADARTQSEAVASAQDAMASASDQATAAQSALNDAQQTAVDSAKEVGEAYKTAKERLDGYAASLHEASLDEREAQLALAEARQKLLNNDFQDPLSRQRAVLAIERAEINLQKAQKAGSKLQREANDAQAKGIDQADEVVAARKNQAQADKAVEAAQRGVAASNRATAKAAEDLAKAQSGAGTSSEKFADALARLSPNAQSFLLAAKELAPTLEGVRKSVQDNLFANLGDQLKETATVVLPAMQAGMGGVATQLNLAAQNALEFLRSAQGMRLVNDSFESGVNLLKGLRSGTGEWTQGFVDFTATAKPAMEGIGRAFAGVGEQIGRAFSDASKNGDLAALFDGFQQALTGLGPLLNGVVSALIIMGKDVLPTLRPLFETLGQVLKAIAPSLGEIGAIFVSSLTTILPVLGDLIKALAEGLKPVLPVLATLLRTIGIAIQPLIEPFSRIAVILGETLVQTIQALAPALVPLATAFADLLNAVAPLIPMIGENLATVIIALAPALSEVFNALAPVIKSFTEQMAPVMKQLAPILAQVAMSLGVALADAITQLAPILPPLITAWSNLILAIAPLLPQLIDLAIKYFPSVVSILIELAPHLTKMIDLFTWLVNNVIIPIVIPAIQDLAEKWKGAFDTIAGAINWVTDTVFPKIQEGLNRVKGWFAEAIDTIGTKWAELTGKAADPVNFVIQTVFNDGLLRAWAGIDTLLGGVLPDAQKIAPIPRRAAGGPIGFAHGPGNGTKDDILTWMSNGEHVVTAAEVVAAGGQNVLFAIRDMIFRGIPFSWDGGKVISDLGKDNLSAYGSRVSVAGLGNVPPEGLFDQLATTPIPRFAVGGPIMPWMYQLQKGHNFARAQNGKPYQWAGPNGIGSSFDCSGFMASIAASILDQNPWQRYWATGSFSGQQVGPQGFVHNLVQGSGFGIGVSNGGPGGGHTAGELRGIPELGIAAARVESGGSIGDVHYGRGTDPNSFQMQYGLPIGANGFFQPAPGGSSNGPSVQDQSSFLNRTIERVFKAATEPIRDSIKTQIGVPPPSIRALPAGVLDGTEKAFASYASNKVGDLGGLLGGAWQKAQDLGDKVLDLVNPFDAGGMASGTGFMPKNVIAPERVLSPEQTSLFEALVVALQKISSGTLGAAGQAAGAVVVDISQASIGALQDTDTRQREKERAETVDAIERTASSTEAVAAQAASVQMEQLLSIGNKLSGDILGPILQASVNAGTTFITDLIAGMSKQVVGAVNGTTRAVIGLGGELGTADTGQFKTASFGMPGSSFDLAGALSGAVVSIADAAKQAFAKVASDITNAALAQTPSRVGNQSKGKLGEEGISGGFLTDFIVKLTGVDIEILDLLENTYEEIQKFRGDAFTGFDASGQLISDTAALVQRNQSSIELAAAESERIQKALIKAVIKYLIVSVLIPIITAVLSAMITLATTAIGAAIGSAIPIIGTAIGAAIGAAVGVALSGMAAVFTSLLAVGAGAALDAFDEGGVAGGLGFMQKNTIAPERVLSPRQTESFEKLVNVLDRNASGNRTVQIGSMTVNGRDPAQKTADNLLALLDT